jgi:hypothetical protein
MTDTNDEIFITFPFIRVNKLAKNLGLLFNRNKTLIILRTILVLRTEEMQKKKGIVGTASTHSY